jgi:hypothetical protein
MRIGCRIPLVGGKVARLSPGGKLKLGPTSVKAADFKVGMSKRGFGEVLQGL